MSKKIDCRLRFIIIISIIALSGAAVLQLFIPTFLGSTSEFDLNPGWQREIGIWNLGLITILLGVLFKGDNTAAKIVFLGGLVLTAGFGTNHLLAYFRDTSKYMSIVGAVENYAFAVLFLFTLIISRGNKHGQEK